MKELFEGAFFCLLLFSASRLFSFVSFVVPFSRQQKKPPRRFRDAAALESTSRRLRLDASLREKRKSGVFLHEPLDDFG
jgi:hypothetical protein